MSELREAPHSNSLIPDLSNAAATLREAHSEVPKTAGEDAVRSMAAAAEDIVLETGLKAIAPLVVGRSGAISR
jgi:hypothetical protein